MRGSRTDCCKERAGFEQFRRRLLDERYRPILDELVESVAHVFWTYDTALRENRFVVGGVIEIILGAALRAAGVMVHHKGGLDSDIDLLFDDDPSAGYSVKTMLKGGEGTRLVNVMGDARPSVDRWQAATLFVLSGGTGIVYADPWLPWWQAHLRECIRVKTDALQVSRACVRRFAAEHPEWVLPCQFPSGRERGSRPYPARTASADIAATVLMHRPRLFPHLPGLRVGEEIPGRRGG